MNIKEQIQEDVYQYTLREHKRHFAHHEYLDLTQRVSVVLTDNDIQPRLKFTYRHLRDQTLAIQFRIPFTEIKNGKKTEFIVNRMLLDDLVAAAFVQLAKAVKDQYNVPFDNSPLQIINGNTI